MSAFSDLIVEAEGLGVTKLTWDVNVVGYRQEDQVERWGCRATVATRDGSPVFLDTLASRGRTGEEALRRIVDFLRRTA